MANLNGMYNPEAEGSKEIGKLPSGEYVAQIVESDMKPTKSGGEFLELVYEVVEGEMKGRKHWERLNLVNANAQTVEIANRQMADIRAATGVIAPKLSEELHYRPHVIRIDFQPAGSKDKKGNVRQYDEATIRGWKALEGGAGNAPASTSQQTPAPSNAAPWKRNKAA